jgi:5'-3' exonuclease
VNVDAAKKLLLIDLCAIFWWKWHASAGKEIDAAYQYTVGKVKSLARGYDHVAVCSDSVRCFRMDIDPSYKATRPPKNPAAVEQLTRVEESLVSDGLLLWKVDGFEADDVIATAVAAALNYDDTLEVVIAGQDKDLLQLLGHRVTMHKVTDDRMVTADGVRQAFGVAPDQMRDWLALVGDTSDNVKGVKGVGAKTAAALLQQCGDIEGIFRAVNETDEEGQPRIKGEAVRRELLAADAVVGTSRKLVTLRRDVPIEFSEVFELRSPKSLRSAGWDSADPDGGAWNDVAHPVSEPLPPIPAPRASSPGPVQKPETAPTSAQAAQVPAKRALAAVSPSAQSGSGAIVVSDPRWLFALEPPDAKSAYVMATHLFNSRLFANYANEDAIFAVIIAGRSMGLDAMTALRGMHIIEGKPCVSAPLMIGQILRSGKAQYFDLVDSTENVATYETTRVGRPRPVTMSFSMDDARKAKLIKDGKADSNWAKYPRTMLRWRAATELARAVYPDVVSNVYTIDEMSNGGASDIMDAEFEAA